MSSFYPLHARGVAEQRVREVSIHAALRVDREEPAIDHDGRHARESVCGQDRREPNIAEGGVVVSLNGGMHAVYAEAAGPECGRRDGPVVLRTAVLGVGCADKAITLVAVANDGGRGEYVVMTAVPSADLVVGRDLMI